MVERVLCKHEVVGSIPSGSTIPAIGKYELQILEQMRACFDIVN